MRAAIPVSDHVRVGLALSGGGARGLAQVGVLKVLEREGIPVHLVTGTSIGAVMGALYACSPDAVATEAKVLATLASSGMQALDLNRILKLSGVQPVSGEVAPEGGWWERAQTLLRRLHASHAALTRQAVVESEQILGVFDALFGDCSFDQTRIPFAAVAVDLEEGREVIIASGRIARAVAASSAIAGIFPPVEIGGRSLVDGGYTSPVPIEAARTMGANVVIAVDVSIRGIDRGGLENAVEVAMRASEISLIALEREQLRRADVVVPARGQERHWSDYSAPQEAIAAGERAAEKMLDSIRAVIEERGRLFA
jgi:NTE family protein